jgi:hypothetical protein
MPKYYQLAIRGLVLGICVGIVVFINQTATSVETNTSKVLSQVDVNVTASVPACDLQITARPASREPAVNNWATTLTVNVKQLNGTSLFTLNSTSDSSGTAYYDLCTNNVSMMPGNYDFFIRGQSHLIKKFSSVEAFRYYATTLSFTNPTDYLTAGETSIVFDNFINGLDLATQLQKLYSTDVDNDLNQDGEVNALDLSITISNIYKSGD